MKYLVGYPYKNSGQLLRTIEEYKDSVSEVFFAWGDFANGRSPVQEMARVEKKNLQEEMLQHLQHLSEIGIAANLLLNGNCYGADALARPFFEKIGNTVDELVQTIQLSSVTTTSPVIAKFIKTNFPNLEIRASVNMSIGSPLGMEYVEDLFDSFYLKREYNRNFDKMKICRDWCRCHGKKLFILANSGCLNDCSVETFHDNLVAHEAEIAKKDNAFDFHGQCWNFLGTEEHRKNWLSHTNFIRPEEVSLCEEFCDGMKLATRVNANPSNVVRAYVNQKYSGSLPALLEPDHSGAFYPNIIENAKLPADFTNHVMHCNKDCENCHYCRKVQQRATIQL